MSTIAVFDLLMYRTGGSRCFAVIAAISLVGLYPASARLMGAFFDGLIDDHGDLLIVKK